MSLHVDAELIQNPRLDFNRKMFFTPLLHSIGRKMKSEVGGNDHNCRNYALGEVVNISVFSFLRVTDAHTASLD